MDLCLQRDIVIKVVIIISSLLKFEILVEFMYFTLLCILTFLFEIWKLFPIGRIDWDRVDLCLQRDIVIKTIIIAPVVY